MKVAIIHSGIERRVEEPYPSSLQMGQLVAVPAGLDLSQMVAPL